MISPTTASVKAVCVDPGRVYRIEANGKPIATALGFSNGMWQLFDTNERCVHSTKYRTPQMVATAAKRMGMHT
jgi:hypothetical protein